MNPFVLHPKQYFVGLIVFLIITLFVGCSGSMQCQKLPAESPEALFCQSHANAIYKFVRINQDPTEQLSRYTAIKAFYNKVLSECKTVACMEEKIFSNQSPEGFSSRYALEHESALQQTQLNRRESAKWMKSGFESALSSLERKFASNPN